MKKRTEYRAKLWTAGDLCDLQLVAATSRNHVFPRHFHDTYVIRVQKSGLEEFYYRQASHVSPAGSIVVIHPDEVRTGRGASEEDWAYRAFYPSPTLIHEVVSESGLKSLPFFSAPVIVDPNLSHSLNHLHNLLEVSGDSLERQAAFLATMRTLITRHARVSTAPQPTRAERRAAKIAREYIEANFRDNLSLDQLASLAGLNRFYFLRSFRKEVGLPPHEFLTQVRIERAKKLLIRGMPIAQVALETGFVDQSHLTHRFKRFVGLTPKQYSQQSSSYKRIFV